LLAAELFALGFLTFRAGSRQWSVELWGLGLTALGISALAGGLFHGLAHYCKRSLLLFLWRAMMAMVMATLGFMTAAGIVSAFSRPVTEVLLLISAIPILFLLIRAARQSIPQMLVEHSSARILPIFVALLLFYFRQVYTGGAEAGQWILIGSLIIVAGIWVQQTKFVLHKHFNQNDICHLFFMAGVYFLYRGGILLRDH